MTVKHHWERGVNTSGLLAREIATLTSAEHLRSSMCGQVLGGEPTIPSPCLQEIATLICCQPMSQTQR